MTTPTLTDNVAASGYVRVAWTGPPGAGFLYYEVYRKYQWDDDYVLIYSTTEDKTNYTFDDYRAPSNSPVVYAVSKFTTGPTGETLVPVTITPGGNNYWLIHPTDNSKHLMLTQVVDDSFDDDYDEEVLRLIGRGRKTDRGTSYGKTGQLSMQVYGLSGITPRLYRQKLEALKDSSSVLYLRTPFGDVFKVGIGQLSFARIPGVGTSEMGTVSFPYFEVV